MKNNQPEINSISSPLKLEWDSTTNQYKVNKPKNQSGLYVDRGIANDLSKALKELLRVSSHHDTLSKDIAIRRAIEALDRADGKIKKTETR